MLEPVIVVGDTMVDILARVDAPLCIGSDTPARVQSLGGGSAANVAAWLAHLGESPILVTRVGDDHLGEIAARELQAAGVQLSITRDGYAPTGTCIVLVGADAERTMLPDPGANDRLETSDIPRDAFRPGRHLHLSGYALIRGGSRVAALEALAAASASGMTVSVDASSAAPLAAAGPDAFLGWCSRAELLLANADEARVLTGLADPVEAVTALAGRFPLAIVKDGARGAWACAAGGDAWHAAAAPLVALDSTGAGDAFAAGFLVRWLRGDAVAESLAYAAHVSGRAVSRVGGRP